MCNGSDKERIYHLINLYLYGKINETTFCRDYLRIYDIELDYDTLNEEEYHTFSNLARIASRFSECEEDIMRYPGVYYTKNELNKEIKEAKTKLNKYWSLYKEFDCK